MAEPRERNGRWKNNKRLKINHHAAFDDDLHEEDIDAETQALIEESSHKWPSRKHKKQSTSRS